MKKLFFLLVIVVFFNKNLFSQKQTTQLQQVWLGYFNQTRFSNKWGLLAQMQLSTKQDFFSNLSETIVTVGAIYYINTNTKLLAAYAHANTYPTDNLAEPEHRPWQQIMWHNNHPRLRLMQWFRLEERFRHKVSNGELAEGYNFNYRARYHFMMTVALSKKAFAPNSFSFVLDNELFINFGKEIVYNYFDQNRFFLGFAFHPNKHDALQFGYLNVFQQLSTGNQYRNVNAARIFYFHNLDLR